ncbi:barstar (barnase inhibitor) [Dyadobacter jejuensis]|uniref:Barstar (Barnase inhibitor) n=1 Tax=Dyadobacter jejuensis TaxID=1082580 RepID=A0A316AH42_9BACT|nr:barstar family protein [Dyadobacter jejuensis]PWJ56588.1 barstar (barnase inhibitor) [Dyadobacter jejuensis]
MRNTHFLLTKNPETVNTQFPNAFVGLLDGKKATHTKAFFEEIAQALNFPEESGTNLDALDEMLNDLGWIDQEQVILLISQSNDWLSNEKSIDKILTIIDIMDATAEDWKWMDEEEGVDKKELKIILEDSPRIRALLEEQEIPFGEI